MKVSKRLVATLVILLIVVGGGTYLYFPREGASASVAATLSILNTDISARHDGCVVGPPSEQFVITSNGTKPAAVAVSPW